MESFDLVNISERYMELINPSRPEKVLTIGKFLGLKEDSRVIDFGCGYGEVLALWAEESGISGIGIDVREHACDRARKKISERGLANCIEIACANAAEYSFERQALDVAACIGDAASARSQDGAWYCLCKRWRTGTTSRPLSSRGRSFQAVACDSLGAWRRLAQRQQRKRRTGTAHAFERLRCGGRGLSPERRGHLPCADSGLQGCRPMDTGKRWEPRLPHIAKLGINCLQTESSLKGYRNDVGEYRKILGEEVCIFGNPRILQVIEQGDEEVWRQDAIEQARGVGEQRRYVICAGSPTTWATTPARLRHYAEFTRGVLAEAVPPLGLS